MAQVNAPHPTSIPVILDTDIGDDIDDTWALAMLLRSPQFDIKLITTDMGRPEYRARIIAKMLERAGRTDIPIGLGAGTLTGGTRQAEWIEDYPLGKFPGTLHKDGVGALIDTVHRSAEPITLLAIGPMTTLAAALERDPSIAPKVNFVGMQGSVFMGYDGGRPVAEYNVKADVKSAQKVLSAPWRRMLITPLDTCGMVDLQGERYARIEASRDPLIEGVLENYAAWKKHRRNPPATGSSILFDTVAIYLADPKGHPLLEMQTLKIVVTDTGMTEVSETGTTMNVATGWKDLDAFREHLVQTMLGARAN